MERNGVTGIPHAFIFNHLGKMVWDGHPSECEPHITEVLKQASAQEFTGAHRTL